MSAHIDILKRLRTQPTRDPYHHAMANEAADEIARLRAALAAQVPQWRPIESAPKDGSAVLVWPPTWSGGAVTAQWCPDQYAKKPRPYWRRSDDLGRAAISREKPPSHWMPTPAAPGASPPPAALALVPVEPTEAMHVAAVRTIVHCTGNENLPPRVWRAMLAASPQATAADMKPNQPLGLGCSEGLGARSRSVTMAELLQPSDGSMVEFWCHRMSQQGKAGAGIRGWFRGGLFWSHDNADHYAPSEVTHWNCLRNALQCAARGCDGCLVCAPNARAKPRRQASA